VKNMAVRTNIIIRYAENNKSARASSDEELVRVERRTDYHGSKGVISTLIKAYFNEAAISRLFRYGHDDVHSLLNSRVREDIRYAASSIVHAGVGFYLPASKLTYQGYAKQSPTDLVYPQYVVAISDQLDNDGDLIWTIILKKNSKVNITRTVKEWQKFSDLDIALENLIQNPSNFEPVGEVEAADESIKGSIYLGEVDPSLLKRIYKEIGPCPCDTCFSRAIDVSTSRLSANYSARLISNLCNKNLRYLRKVQNYLLRDLSHDTQLKRLLSRVCAEVYWLHVRRN
jgi:hypothetical protein